MTSNDWYRNNYLRVLFDAGVIDASPEALSRIDPVDLVKTIADAGLETLVFYVQCPTGWLYYPSEIGHQHPSLKGRDIIGECVEECRRHGLKFMGYYVPYEMGCESVEHPEWRTEFIGDTVPSSPRLWGNLCWNRPGCWDFYLSIVRESVSKYGMDGVFIDNFWRRHCGCGDCQKRYRMETGRELPRDFPGSGHPYVMSELERPEMSVYLHRISLWVNQWAMDLRNTVRSIRPDCAITFQYVGPVNGALHGYNLGVSEAADFIGLDSAFLPNQLQHSYAMKCVRGFSRNLPFDSHMSIAEHHSDETSPKQEGLIKQQFGYVLAHGGSITYIDDIYWDGRISKQKYLRMKNVNAWAKERIPYLGGNMVADVGIYMSHESNAYWPNSTHWRWNSQRGDSERSSMHSAGNAAMIQALLRENVPFELVHRNKLEAFGRHKVLFMSSVEVLSEREAQAVREFVSGGGGLVITHRTSLRDEFFQMRDNFLLEDVISADYIDRPDVCTTHVVVRPEDRIAGFFDNVHPELPFFDIHGSQCYVRPKGGAVGVGLVARPRRPYNEDGWPVPGVPPVRQLLEPDEVRQATMCHMYVPEIITDYPAVVLSSYGKGRVAYCAGFPCYDYVDDIHDLLVSLVKWAWGDGLDPTVISDAPAPVEILAMDKPEVNQTVIHAINWQPSWPGVSAHEIRVGVKSEGREARRVFAVECACELQFSIEDHRICFTLPSVNEWETAVIDWS